MKIPISIFVREYDIPLKSRGMMIDKIGACRVELDNRYWDAGDEWIEKDSGISVDMVC